VSCFAQIQDERRRKVDNNRYAMPKRSIFNSN
jgi:hypothetical protein